MKRFFFLVISFIVLGRVVGCAASIEEVCFSGQCFEVEIADQDEERIKGLQGREILPPDQGMLFVFERPDYYGFWMKKTLIPLDMIWLNEEFQVVHFEQSVPPCPQDVNRCPSYIPNEMARYVLEINAGLVQELGLSKGDILERK